VTSSDEVPVNWMAMEDVVNPPQLAGNTRHESFGDYVKDRLPSIQDSIESRYVRFSAADFPEG
jgi:hypothetical protein